MIRIADKRAVAIEQAKVDAPRIHPDAGDLAKLPGRKRNAAEDFVMDTQDVPMQVPRHSHRPVAKAMYLVECQLIAVELTDDRPTAFRAQVNGNKISGGHRDTPTRDA
jgi:hypothetical protein